MNNGRDDSIDANKSCRQLNAEDLMLNLSCVALETGVN
jgi:hypothetical protein